MSMVALSAQASFDSSKFSSDFAAKLPAGICHTPYYAKIGGPTWSFGAAEQMAKVGGEQTFAARTAYLAMTTKADIQAISNIVFTHAATIPS